MDRWDLSALADSLCGLSESKSPSFRQKASTSYNLTRVYHQKNRLLSLARASQLECNSQLSDTDQAATGERGNAGHYAVPQSESDSSSEDEMIPAPTRMTQYDFNPALLRPNFASSVLAAKHHDSEAAALLLHLSSELPPVSPYRHPSSSRSTLAKSPSILKAGEYLMAEAKRARDAVRAKHHRTKHKETRKIKRMDEILHKTLEEVERKRKIQEQIELKRQEEIRRREQEAREKAAKEEKKIIKKALEEKKAAELKKKADDDIKKLMKSVPKDGKGVTKCATEAKGEELIAWFASERAKAEKFGQQNKSKNLTRMRMGIRKASGQIARTLKGCATSASKMLEELRKAREYAPEAHLYITVQIIERLVEKGISDGDTSGGGQADAAYGAAYVAALIIAREGKIFNKMLRAYIHEKCRYTMPCFPEGKSLFTPEDTEFTESQRKYIRFYAACLQIHPPRGDIDYLKQQRELIRCYDSKNGFKLKAPFGGMQRAWQWISHTLNIQPNSKSGILLMEFLKYCGFRLHEKFGSQARKLLRFVKDVYMPHLNKCQTYLESKYGKGNQGVLQCNAANIQIGLLLNEALEGKRGQGGSLFITGEMAREQAQI